MYAPEPVPPLADLPGYIVRELLRIAANFAQIYEGDVVRPRGSPPAKPREGMLAVADGVGWNPGAGKGLYEYKSGGWVKL